MKTAVTLLQEFMVKNGDIPDFECITQCGPAHSAVFEYRCQAHGVTVVAAARSKRDAKQEAARRALLALAAAGRLPADIAVQAKALPIPPPVVAPPTTAGTATAALEHPDVPPPAAASTDPSPNAYVALLKELCEEYRLGAVEYPVVGDSGPAHQRQFTVAARLGQHERRASAGKKKEARQAAAEALYTYLRTNLAHLTADFVESEALERAHERVMERLTELRPAAGERPPLMLRVADYHKALPDLLAQQDEAIRSAARRALERGTEADVLAAAEALQLSPEWAELGQLPVLTLRGTCPEATLVGRERDGAVAAARRLLLHALS